MAYENYFPDDPIAQKYARMMEGGKREYSLPWLKDPSPKFLEQQTGLLDKVVGSDPTRLGADLVSKYEPTGLISTGSGPMSAAIASKYQRDMNRELSNLRTASEIDRPMTASKYISEAADIGNKIKSVQQQNIMQSWTFDAARDSLRRQREAAKAQAEASFISSIFGLVGTIGGALIAGPAGAMVGGGLGAAAGGAVSGSKQTPGRDY